MTIRRRDLLVGGGSVLGGAAFALLAPQWPASAHEYTVGEVKVEHPWLRAPKEGETTAYLFALISNKGATPDKLVGVKAAAVGRTAIYVGAHEDKAADALVIPPKKKLTLKPGGPHVALLDIKKYLQVGWGLELTLVFEKAGEVTIDASIEAPDAKRAHDAQAMQRWEKAHGKDTSGAAPPSGHEHH
ncbi:MAG: copper chaperone PCu(A)C, partial [Methylocystis sp.]|nr:copper chaperone PCu(A)C [Methylocystis sp.]